MTPYVSAAVGAYGGAVLAKVRDDAADATVGLGRRLLQRVFGSRREGEPPPEPLGALIADPEDDDALAAVRLAIRRALTDDASLQAEVRSMLAGAPSLSRSARGVTPTPRDVTRRSSTIRLPTGPNLIKISDRKHMKDCGRSFRLRI